MGTAASAESSFDLNASAAEETERESEREPGRTPELRVWRMLVSIRQEPEKKERRGRKRTEGEFRRKIQWSLRETTRSLPNDRFIQNS